MKHLFVLCIFTALSAQGLFEDAVESESDKTTQAKLFELNGYIRGVYYGGKIPDEMDVETKSAYGDAALKLSAGKSEFGKAFAELRLGAGYESDSAFSSFDLREAYLGVFPGPFDIHIGKQIIAWGRADAFNPTNVITPQKFYIRSPNEDDRRLGNFLVRSQLTINPVRFELLWIPVYGANELPVNKDIISQFITSPLFPVTVMDIIEDYPDASFNNSGFAVKVNLELAAVDGSISYFNGYSPAPGIDVLYTITPEFVLEITPHFKAYRMHLIGCDLATTLGSFIGLRGECAYRTYFKDYKKFAYIPNPDLQYVIGVDKTIKDFSFILQYSGIFVFDFEELPDSVSVLELPEYESKEKNRMISRQTDQVGHSILFRPSWSLLHETLSLELAGMYSINTEELMLRPKISYQINDALTATIGGELYVGSDESLFDLLEEEVSAGFVELKASF